MVQGHHLQLRSHPPLFHNLWQFSVKMAATHHPVVQKKVDELFSKGAIETFLVVLVSIAVCMFSLSILVASGLNLTLNGLIVIYIYLLFKMPYIRYV